MGTGDEGPEGPDSFSSSPFAGGGGGGGGGGGCMNEHAMPWAVKAPSMWIGDKAMA